MTDPRETAKCACPRLDGYDCYRFRNRIDVDDFNRDTDGGPCECYCHELYEEDIADEDAGEAARTGEEGR